ncbi:MAG: sulfocyanin-like copper-binding protein [Clostridia bacterium]
MKEKVKQQGITLIALVITIVILIILAGISVNTLIGENGIITKAKQAKQNITLAGEAEAMQLNQLYYELEIGGELTEDEQSSKKDEIIALLQKQVEELQKQVTDLQTENTQLKEQIEDLTIQVANLQKEIADLKAQIASKDIEVAELKKQVGEKEAKIQDLQNQLNNLNSLLSQTNVTADKILSGYKAYSGGKLLTGTMVNRGAVNSSLNCGESYTIPAGYHNGSGKIMANSLASQTQSTADASKILLGYTAYVNGNKITGANKGYDVGYNDGVSSSTIKFLESKSLGESTSYTVNTTKITNYNKLTADNFLVVPTGCNYSNVGYAGGSSNPNNKSLGRITVTYNASNGTLTLKCPVSTGAVSGQWYKFYYSSVDIYYY